MAAVVRCSGLMGSAVSLCVGLMSEGAGFYLNNANADGGRGSVPFERAIGDDRPVGADLAAVVSPFGCGGDFVISVVLCARIVRSVVQ